MLAISVIVGFLFIICGIYSIAAPVGTFFSTTYFLAALMFVYGIFGIIRFFKRRALVPEFIVSILSVVIGFVYLFRPGNTPAVGNLIGFDRVILFLIAGWFLIKGCVNVYLSVRTRFINRRWIIGFLVGLLSIVLGIYSFIYPYNEAAVVGVLIGMWFIESGIDILTFGTTTAYMMNVIDETKREIDQAVDQAVTSAESYAKALAATTAESDRERAAEAEKAE